MLFAQFDAYEAEAMHNIEKELVHPAYDYILKCSHAFNLLDARGVISVSDRAGYLARIRKMARAVATSFVNKREALGFPLLKSQEPTA